MLHDDCSDDRQQRWAHAHAILIGLVRGVLQQIIPAKVFAEAMPLAVACDPDKNLLAVGGGERLVNSPGAFARRHGRRRPAGDRLPGEMLRH